MYTKDELRERFPEYTHRIFHIFKANIFSDKKDDPTEIDFEIEFPCCLGTEYKDW